jgi:hypothetical protein
MFFIILTLLSALLLEGIGTIVSVIGLVQLFGFTELIVALAIAFDIAKVTSVTVLYREWGKMSKLLRTYLTAASFVLMTITSMGAASYLSTNFQKSSLPVKTLEVKVKSMTEEKVKLEARKKEIDAQIANLPSDYVKGRTKLLNNFKTEIERINDRIVQLDVEVPKVQTEMIDATSHAGPIMYLATALKSTPEAAMGWLIGLMIFVFDPLAVALILAGNYLVAQRTPKEIKASLLPIPVEEIIEDIPLDKELPSGFEFDDQIEEDYNPQYFWNDYPKEVNESHTDLELEPLEDRDEESIEEESVIHEESEDPDKNFYPYFSPGMVEQAKSVAKLPEVEEEPTIHSSLNEVHIPSEHIVQFDNSLPSQNVKHYTSNTYL